MNATAYPDITATLEIDAPPAAVWSLISDPRRMAELSPQVKKVFVFGKGVKQGTRSLNINGQGKLRWPTNTKIVTFEPERRLAFRVTENRTVWTYDLEPTENGGTKITEKRTAPDGVSGLSRLLTRSVLGGTEEFEQGLERGMKKTLEKIKAAVETDRP